MRKRITLVLILIFTILIAGCSSESQTQRPTPAPTTPSPTPANQDLEFVRWVMDNSKIIVDDLDNLGAALKAGDTSKAERWARQMKSDTETSIDWCDDFKVSDDLLFAKSQYKSYLSTMREISVNVLDYTQNGNVGSLNKVSQKLNIAMDLFNQTVDAIKGYCASHSCQ